MPWKSSLAADSKYFVYPPLLPCRSRRNILSHKSIHTERKTVLFKYFYWCAKESCMFRYIDYIKQSQFVRKWGKTAPYELVINLRRQKPNKIIIGWQLGSAWMHLLFYKSFNGQSQEYWAVVLFFHFICEVDWKESNQKKEFCCWYANINNNVFDVVRASNEKWFLLRQFRFVSDIDNGYT